MADDCLPRLRVFLDASLLALLVLIALTLHRRVVKQETPPKTDDGALYNYLRPPFRRSVVIAVLSLAAWGVLGLVLSLEHDCPSSNWLVVLCMSLSGGCLLVGTWLGMREALLTIDFDLLTLIWCIRCSCCSRLTKRALLLPPLGLLVTLNIASYLENRFSAVCNASELLSPKTFFAGTAVVFLAMFVATLLTVGYPLISRKNRTSSSRLRKVLVAIGLAALALASIGWAVVGLISLPERQDGVGPATLYADSCWDDLEVLHTAQWSLAQLLVVGGLLLITTFCCRLENFFLAPNAPEIDLAQLSPRLSAIKNPFEASAKSSEVRIPQDSTVVV